MRKTERIQQTASQNGSQDAAMMIDTCTSKYVIGPTKRLITASLVNHCYQRGSQRLLFSVSDKDEKHPD